MSGAQFREASQRFQKIGAAVDRGARRAEAVSAERFTATARLLAPTETGALGRSMVADGGAVRIVDAPGDQDPANYYDLIEYGTSRITPRPFLRPAAALLVGQVPLIARREIAQAVAAEVARMQGGRPGR